MAIFVWGRGFVNKKTATLMNSVFLICETLVIYSEILVKYNEIINIGKWY